MLAFGRWETARIATAGLNPSEDEFRDKHQIAEGGLKLPLRGQSRRFIHWPSDGVLTPALEEEACLKAEGYFELGNTYWDWFRNYSSFLLGLEMTFTSGLACHTDYVSPFATVRGLSKCGKTREKLRVSGFRYWLRLIEMCPQLELIFGHGRGWRDIEDNFRVALTDLLTPFDHKGGASRHLSWATVQLPESGREIPVYWWHPNRDGAPLCWLKDVEKRALAEIISCHREHSTGSRKAP